MSPRAVVANVAGLVIGTATAWALQELMGVGSPTRTTLAATLIMVAAIPATLLAEFAGGRFALPALLTGSGAGVLWYGLEHDSREGVVFGVAWLVALPLVKWLRAMRERRATRLTERLLATGTQAIATIIAIRDTGITRGHDPKVTITVRIKPLDGGEAFDAQRTTYVSRLAIPQVGQDLPVWFDPADRTQWTVHGLGS